MFVVGSSIPKVVIRQGFRFVTTDDTSVCLCLLFCRRAARLPQPKAATGRQRSYSSVPYWLHGMVCLIVLFFPFSHFFAFCESLFFCLLPQRIIMQRPRPTLRFSCRFGCLFCAMFLLAHFCVGGLSAYPCSRFNSPFPIRFPATFRLALVGPIRLFFSWLAVSVTTHLGLLIS